MVRKYNARYILLEANGNRSYKDIDITYPEDKSRDARSTTKSGNFSSVREVEQLREEISRFF